MKHWIAHLLGLQDSTTRYFYVPHLDRTYFYDRCATCGKHTAFMRYFKGKRCP